MSKLRILLVLIEFSNFEAIRRVSKFISISAHKRPATHQNARQKRVVDSTNDERKWWKYDQVGFILPRHHGTHRDS